MDINEQKVVEHCPHCRFFIHFQQLEKNGHARDDRGSRAPVNAGGAQAILTKNVRDFSRMELRFPHLRIVTPAALSKE